MKIFTSWVLMLIAFSVVAFAQSASSQKSNTADTLREAYQKLFFAVKSKNTDEIKQNMSKKTIEFCGYVAEQQKKPIADIYRNGLTATTLSEKMPQMKGGRIKDGFGSLDVKNPKGKWEDLPFVFEDGNWKLAIGESFAGTYKKPK